ncbi:hypothetical protein LCGC14_2881930, partial [marine sediment metagenome]
LATLEVKEDVPFIEKIDLPKDWMVRPYPQSTRSFGAAWASQNTGFCVAVPSVRIPLFRFPEEHNILLNPLYPDFSNYVHVVDTKIVNFEINNLTVE